MNFLSRLDRLSALRPASHRSIPVTSEKRDDLAGSLGGMICRTNRGEHIAVEERLPAPTAVRPAPEAIALLCDAPPAGAEDSERWLFLDTETTGLAGGTGTYAFLVGLAWWDSMGFTVRQLFMRDPRDEPSLLAELMEHLAQRRVLVTFNGKSFDWPLLETRFRMARMGLIPLPVVHLDLLHPARQLWRHGVKSAALSELERNVLGIAREDDISSAEIPRIYFDFLRGSGTDQLAAVFRHNRLDLAGLGRLTLRVLSLLADADAAQADAVELYGLSRIIQRRGDPEHAARLYERSLHEGLPLAAATTARRELALLAKRKGDYERASLFWGELAEETRDDVRSCEELAIYFEHRVRDLAQAARLTREAIARAREAYASKRISAERFQRLHFELQHRLARITRKHSA
jgi:uncharacterized protein